MYLLSVQLQRATFSKGFQQVSVVGCFRENFLIFKFY